MSVILRVSALYREFALDAASLYDSVQSRDKLVVTAGFHSLGADGETMGQTGLGYETRPQKGIIVRLFSGESGRRDLNESGNCRLAWHLDSLHIFLLVLSLDETKQAIGRWEQGRKMLKFCHSSSLVALTQALTCTLITKHSPQDSQQFDKVGIFPSPHLPIGN